MNVRELSASQLSMQIVTLVDALAQQDRPLSPTELDAFQQSSSNRNNHKLPASEFRDKRTADVSAHTVKLSSNTEAVATVPRTTTTTILILNRPTPHQPRLVSQLNVSSVASALAHQVPQW